MYFLATTFLLVIMILMAASAVLALFWAAKTGQFSNLGEASQVIFDEDEPVGNVTDHFPTGVDKAESSVASRSKGAA